MGRRGPKTRPTQLKIAKGNPRKENLKRQIAAEPKPRPGIPDMPDGMDETAQECWRHVVDQVEYMGLLTKADLQSLEAYCQEWSRWKACVMFRQKHGEFMPIKDGDKIVEFKQFVQSKVETALLQSILRYQREFGLTPSGRADLVVPDGKGDDLDRFLNTKPRVG